MWSELAMTFALSYQRMLCMALLFTERSASRKCSGGKFHDLHTLKKKKKWKYKLQEFWKLQRAEIIGICQDSCKHEFSCIFFLQVILLSSCVLSCTTTFPFSCLPVNQGWTSFLFSPSARQVAPRFQGAHCSTLNRFFRSKTCHVTFCN